MVFSIIIVKGSLKQQYGYYCQMNDFWHPLIKNRPLICTLISENQGLEKLRSVSNLRKISGPAHLDFISVCHLDFFQVYGINLAFFRWGPRKKSRFAGPGIIFLRFEADLDFSTPWFSEIKVQIKRPYVVFRCAPTIVVILTEL